MYKSAFVALLSNGNTAVCSIVLDDDQQPHASLDKSKMDIDTVSMAISHDDTVIVDSSVEGRLDRNLRKRVSSFGEDDDDNDDTFNYDGKSESPSYIDDNNADCGEVDDDNDGNDDYVYDENDESNPTGFNPSTPTDTLSSQAAHWR
jgi:hypothetical protein